MDSIKYNSVDGKGDIFIIQQVRVLTQHLYVDVNIVTLFGGDQACIIHVYFCRIHSGLVVYHFVWSVIGRQDKRMELDELDILSSNPTYHTMSMFSCCCMHSLSVSLIIAGEILSPSHSAFL